LLHELLVSKGLTMTIAIKDVRPALRLPGSVSRRRRPALTPAPSEHLAWRQPVDGLWVAETPSAYLGMIERVDDGFVASAADGRTLGTFAAVADARIAVYASWFRRDETPGLIGWAQGILRKAFAA
jgi:hypothetical protein